MSNYYTDNEDLRFYVERGIDWAPLVEATEYGWKSADGFKNPAEALAFYKDILELVGGFVADEIAPAAAEIDAQGVKLENGEGVFPPRLQGIFDKLKELELHGMCVPRELGGQNTPAILYFMNAEIMARGDVSVMAHHSFHGGIALAMLVFSVLEGTTKFDVAGGKIASTRWAKELGEIIRGEAWGAMDITEPDAGSDMAALRCVGEQDEHGSWFVTGQKIFITSGHGKYHFVIARTEKPQSGDDPFAGLAGLSMFLVPTYEDLPDGTRRRIVKLGRIEEKLGHHGSATCSLDFERAPAQLVGKRGEGFKYMLTLMNNARLGVGFESLGMCEAAYRAAKHYASERGSMGKTIDRHEMIADYLDEMRTDVQGIRALAMVGAYHEELATKLSLFADYVAGVGGADKDELARRVRHHKKVARRLTPLLKYLAAEKAVEMARRAVQIHGGNGYIREYPVEKLLRDAMVMPIYEGTSQIQSLMAMKDTLGAILKNPQRFVRRLAQARWRALSSKDPLVKRLARIQSLSLAAQQHLVLKTAGAKARQLQGKPITQWPRLFAKDWNPKRDFALAMLHAERLTRILIDEAVGELLCEQAAKFPERREVAERYLERAEPRCRFLHDEIVSTGERLLAQLGGGETASSGSQVKAAS